MLRRPCFSTTKATGGSAGLSSVRTWSLWFEKQSNIKESQHWCNLILSGSFPQLYWVRTYNRIFLCLTSIQPQGAAWICTKVTEGIWLRGLRVMLLSVRNWCAGLSHHLWIWPANRHLPLLTGLAWRWTRRGGNVKGGGRGGVRVTGRWSEQKAVILNLFGMHSLWEELGGVCLRCLKLWVLLQLGKCLNDQSNVPKPSEHPPRVEVRACMLHFCLNDNPSRWERWQVTHVEWRNKRKAWEYVLGSLCLFLGKEAWGDGAEDLL